MPQVFHCFGDSSDVIGTLRQI